MVRFQLKRYDVRREWLDAVGGPTCHRGSADQTSSWLNAEAEMGQKPRLCRMIKGLQNKYMVLRI